MAATAVLSTEKQRIKQMSGIVALLSLVTLAISFSFLPDIKADNGTLMLLLGLGIAFFALYTLLPRLYLNETFLMVSDAVYIALITYAASQAGQYGILILFLYFVVIAADAMKYPLSEYVFVVLVTVQAAFFYIVLWSPFTFEARIGILTLFIFSIVSMAIFVWYFVYQFAYEQSMRYSLEKKSKYLQTVNEHLKAVDKMRQSIIDVTSHEFQTPLTVVRHSLSNLRTSELDKMTPQQLHYIEVAAENNNRVIGLVKDLLSSSRLQSGKWELRVAEYDLAEQVSEIVADYRDLAKEKKVKLTADIPRKAVLVEADANLIRIAVKNLVDNAIKYTSAGTVTVTLTVKAQELRVVVSDTGIGIDKVTMPHLFSQFTRSDEAILAHPDGFGIGLHHARVIIRRHGGDITVKSMPGKGSIFTVSLPKHTSKVKKSK